jgi:hypothetical protein
MEEGEEADDERAGGAEPSAVAAGGAPVAVRVAVRVRPLSERERAMGCRECVAVQGAATTLSAEPGGGNGKEDKTFVFDFSYWHDVPQGVVYRDLAKPIVEAALDGFNGVIFVRRRVAHTLSHLASITSDLRSLLLCPHSRPRNLVDGRACACARACADVCGCASACAYARARARACVSMRCLGLLAPGVWPDRQRQDTHHDG